MLGVFASRSRTPDRDARRRRSRPARLPGPRDEAALAGADPAWWWFFTSRCRGRSTASRASSCRRAASSQQQAQGTGSTSSGRLAHIAPGIREWSAHAVFGEGFGSRVTEGSGPIGHYGANASILDNQWLGLLLETGLVGLVAWIWLFGSFFRRMGRRARDPSPLGWLYAGLAASTLAFGVGMFTYDAFGFIQVTFLFFIMLALGAALSQTPSPGRARLGVPRAASPPVATEAGVATIGRAFYKGFAFVCASPYSDSARILGIRVVY